MHTYSCTYCYRYSWLSINFNLCQTLANIGVWSTEFIRFTSKLPDVERELVPHPWACDLFYDPSQVLPASLQHLYRPTSFGISAIFGDLYMTWECIREWPFLSYSNTPPAFASLRISAWQFWTHCTRKAWQKQRRLALVLQCCKSWPPKLEPSESYLCTQLRSSWFFGHHLLGCCRCFFGALDSSGPWSLQWGANC